MDIHTVGAGGGSIARVDAGGSLRVGPESAGARPGPACYGRSLLPTVTCAHLVAGHLAGAGLLGGGFARDGAAARGYPDAGIAISAHRLVDLAYQSAAAGGRPVPCDPSPG